MKIKFQKVKLKVKINLTFNFLTRLCPGLQKYQNHKIIVASRINKN